MVYSIYKKRDKDFPMYHYKNKSQQNIHDDNFINYKMNQPINSVTYQSLKQIWLYYFSSTESKRTTYVSHAIYVSKRQQRVNSQWR